MRAGRRGFSPFSAAARTAVVQCGEGLPEPAPVHPAALGDLASEALRGLERSTSGDNDADAVERGVGEGEVAENRDVENLARKLALSALTVVDEVRVRPLARQKGDGRRHDRHADEGRLRRCTAAQDRAQDVRGFLAPFQHVDVGVGLVGDQHIGGLHHRFRNIGVEIEGGHDRHIGAHRRAQAREHVAVRIGAAGGDHGAVVRDIDRIHRTGRPQASHDVADHLVEERLIHRPPGV